MFYKNSQNCEVQSIFFFLQWRTAGQQSWFYWPSWGELQGRLAQSLAVNTCVWP